MLIHLFLVVGCHQGADLDIALTAEDYQVTVDDLPCPVVLLTRTVLSCNIDVYTYIGAHQAAVKVLVSCNNIKPFLCCKNSYGSISCLCCF